MTTITPVNSFTMPAPTTPTQNEAKNNPQLSTSQILLPQGLLLLAAGGHSAKTYFDNRGKAVVYEDMAKVFAEGSAERKGMEDCLKLAKNNMKDAKKGGIILLTTLAITTAWTLIAHACNKKQKTNIEDYVNIDKVNNEFDKTIANA